MENHIEISMLSKSSKTGAINLVENSVGIGLELKKSQKVSSF